jgi:hypothetical protein
MLSLKTLVLMALASWGVAAQDGSNKDLGTVLAENDNLSTFYDLIQVRSHVRLHETRASD